MEAKGKEDTWFGRMRAQEKSQPVAKLAGCHGLGGRACKFLSFCCEKTQTPGGGRLHPLFVYAGTRTLSSLRELKNVRHCTFA